MTSFRIIRRKEGGTKLHIENGIFTLCELNENYTKTKIKNQFQAKIQNETFRTEHNICRKSWLMKTECATSESNGETYWKPSRAQALLF